MQQTVNETEQKVIEILVNHEDTPCERDALITASRVLGWTTEKTEKFVTDLESRKLVHSTRRVRKGLQWDPKYYWEQRPTWA